MIIHTSKFIPKNVNTYLNNKNKECVSLYDMKFIGERIDKGSYFIYEDTTASPIRYLISGEMSNYEASKDKLMSAALKNEEVEVKYVKKYLKRYVNEVI